MFVRVKKNQDSHQTKRGWVVQHSRGQWNRLADSAAGIETPIEQLTLDSLHHLQFKGQIKPRLGKKNSP